MWSGSEDWSTATAQLEVATLGQTDSVSDMVIDKSVCSSLTRIELLYLSTDGWYAKDITLDCGGVVYSVLGSNCTWFDLANDYGAEWLHTYELVSRVKVPSVAAKAHHNLAPHPHLYLAMGRLNR